MQRGSSPGVRVGPGHTHNTFTHYCVETQTDCQRYTAGTTYMKHRLSALHAGTTCVRDTNWLSALHDGITCMNTVNTSVCTSLAVLILRCFFLDIVGLTASKSCFNLTLQPGRYDPHPTPVPLSPPQSSKHRQPKRLVKDRFLRLARLFGTVCLRHSATLIPFFLTLKKVALKPFSSTTLSKLSFSQLCLSVEVVCVCVCVCVCV